jgi:Carboxypeptidase regulatory-like domain
MKNHMTFRFGTNVSSRPVFALLLIGLLTAYGNSQTTTSLTLRIRLVDTQGSVVPGATVVLKREGTEQEITRITATDGTVTFANLQPGTTNLRVEATGFPTLEQSVTVSVNQSNDFILSIEPTPFKTATVSADGRAAIERGEAPKDSAQDDIKCGGNIECITDKVRSLRLGVTGRFARGLQYQYQLNEQPGSLLVGSGAVILKNPEHYLQQHTLTFKFGELFPDRLYIFKRGSDYLKKYPQAADAQLPELLCGDKPLITCLTKGGSWWQRALMGGSISVSLSERAAVQQGFIVTSPKFGKHYQVNGGFVFDPAKLFPTVVNWKSTFDDIQKIDNALALLGASDAIEGRPWKQPWTAALLPKVEFKILSQFDFVKYNGILIAAPFPERALKTWSFTWDLTRVIPDTKSRIDADTLVEALRDLKSNLGRKKEPTPQKQCILHFPKDDRVVDVQPIFSAESCQKLAKLLEPEKYELSCELKGGPEGRDVHDNGPKRAPSDSPVKPSGNLCRW